MKIVDNGRPLMAWIRNFTPTPMITPTSKSVASTPTIVLAKMTICSRPIRQILMNSEGEASLDPV